MKFHLRAAKPTDRYISHLRLLLKRARYHLPQDCALYREITAALDVDHQ